MSRKVFRSRLVKAIFTITLNTGLLEKFDSFILIISLVFFVLGSWKICVGCESEFMTLYCHFVGKEVKLDSFRKAIVLSKGIKKYRPGGYIKSPRYSYCFSKGIMKKYFE